MESKDNLREFLIGKIIKGSSLYESCLCLFFTDGTHQIFHADCSWDDKSVELIEDSELGIYELWKLGIITQEEYRELEQVRNEAEKSRRFASEKKKYEELRRKFESQGTEAK